MKTESQLRRNVINEMGAEPMIDVNRIDIEVRDGIVFLIGQVESLVEKNAAEGATYRATGRRAIAARLGITRSRPECGDETWVNEVRGSPQHGPNEIRRALEWPVRRVQRMYRDLAPSTRLGQPAGCIHARSPGHVPHMHGQAAVDLMIIGRDPLRFCEAYLRDDIPIERGFSASLGLKDPLRAIWVSWGPSRHSGESDRGTLKVSPK